jgi:hypothetical protein
VPHENILNKFKLDSYSVPASLWIFSVSNNAVNEYTPFAEVACLIISAAAAPVADFARTTKPCKAAGTVILSMNTDVNKRGETHNPLDGGGSKYLA